MASAYSEHDRLPRRESFGAGLSGGVDQFIFEPRQFNGRQHVPVERCIDHQFSPKVEVWVDTSQNKLPVHCAFSFFGTSACVSNLPPESSIGYIRAESRPHRNASAGRTRSSPFFAKLPIRRESLDKSVATQLLRHFSYGRAA
jgi:hypothetical protein